MLIRYILSSLVFITYSYADIASQCLSLEKKYFLKELAKINCPITEYTEDDDKLHCIENIKSYGKVIQEIDLLFQNIIEEVQSDDDYNLNIEKGRDICYSLGSRVSDISRGGYGKHKEQLLTEVSREIKHKYRTKLLNSLVTYPRELPTQCVDELKSFLSKKLKRSSFLHIKKDSYYLCLSRYPSIKKIEPKVKEKNKPDNNLGKAVSHTPPDDDFELSGNTNPKVKEKNKPDNNLGKVVSHTYEDNTINHDYDNNLEEYKNINHNYDNNLEEYKNINHDYDNNLEEYKNINHDYNNLEEYKNIVRDTCSKIEEYSTQPCNSRECINTRVDRYKHDILEIITQYNHIKNVDIYDSNSCKNLVKKLNGLRDLQRYHRDNQYKNAVRDIKTRFLDSYRKYLTKNFSSSSPLRCYKVILFSLRENKNPEVPTNMGCYAETKGEFTVGKCDNITEDQFQTLKNIPYYKDIKMKGKVQCK